MNEMDRIAGIASRVLKDGVAFGVGGKGQTMSEISESAKKCVGGIELECVDSGCECGFIGGGLVVARLVQDAIDAETSDLHRHLADRDNEIIRLRDLAHSYGGICPSCGQSQSSAGIVMLLNELAEAKALADEYHGQSGCYATAWKQRAEKAEAELAEAKARRANLRELLEMSMAYINTPHVCYASGCPQCLLAQAISKALAEAEGGE